MPQLEDGYVRIANELLEALAHTRIPGEARQVFDCIVRKTYGWGKKTDTISLSQFCVSTGLKKPTIIRAIKKLLSMNLIIKKDNGAIAKYGINKNYLTWTPLTKKITLTKKIKSVDKKDKKPLSKKIPTKDNTYTKERKKEILEDLREKLKAHEQAVQLYEKGNNKDPWRARAKQAKDEALVFIPVLKERIKELGGKL